jgi:hypothetical protein
MMDKWPSARNLSLTATHLLWRFERSGTDLIKFFVAVPGVSFREVDLPIAFVPILGCFDLEYWNTMALNEVEGDVAMSLRVQMMKKYMQSMQLGIVEVIFSATDEERQDPTWKTNVAHGWSTRTFNNFSHSDFSRGEYLKWCKRKHCVPYGHTLTTES